MKRGGYLQRHTPLKSKTRLRVKGISDTAELKDEIQRLVREIVIIRDGGCILRDRRGVPQCGGFRRDGEMVLQADHLITRANSATYAATDLIVCVCKGHHGWKKWHEREYNAFLKEHVLSPQVVALWERCERESWRPVRTTAYDWKLTVAALKQELRKVQSRA